MNVLKYFKRFFTLNSFKEYNFTIPWSVMVFNELHEHMNATCKICKMCFINHEKKNLRLCGNISMAESTS